MAPEANPQGGHYPGLMSITGAQIDNHFTTSTTITSSGASQTSSPSSYSSGNPNTNGNSPQYSSSPSSSANSFYSDGQLGDAGHGGVLGLPPFLLATIIIVPLIVIGVSILALCLIVRAKRRQRQRRTAIPEMKNLTPRPRDERTYVRPPSSELPSLSVAASSPPQPTRLATDTPPTQRQSQPVILSTTMDQAYYTGLDTADHISMTDARSQVSTDLYDGDEPPPPYRPRSVPPISRDASVRTSYTSRTASTVRRNNDHSATNLMSSVRTSHDWRSPFEDPDNEDDAVSLTSDVTIRPQRHAPQQDRLSVVSDLSYQDEPVTGGSA